MRRLLILCVLLIIAVYANAVPYSNEIEDANGSSEDIDSLESFEDGVLDADMSSIHEWDSHEKHSKGKKTPHGHSKEKKSKEKKGSKESKDRLTISEDAIVLPHEKYCKYFYVFDELEASLVSCSRGYRFDSEKLQCFRTKEVNCGKRRKNVDSSEEKKARINFKCPKWSGFHEHEYYCHLYYSCQNKKGRLFKCPTGKLFDNHNKKCDDRGKVYCNKRIDPNDDNQRPTIKPEVFVCPKSSGKYPHERNCGAFYKCDDRKYKIQHCSKGKLYNERKRTCEPESKVTCGSRIHPDLDPDEPEDKVIDPNPKFNCLENFGRYNHEQYCNWYYQCHDRRPSVRGCRRGWRYHSRGRRCREGHEVTCDGKRDYEDATTEEITTITVTTEPESITPSEPEKTPTEPETTSSSIEPKTALTPTELETTPTPTDPETIPTDPETTPTDPETTPTEPETTTPTPTEPETTSPTPTEPETTRPTPTEPETTTPTPTEPETTTPTPTEQETTPTEPETTTTTPTESETTPTPTELEPTTTTEEPTTTKQPVTAPDTDCDENDVDCIIEDLGITPAWFVCPEDMGGYPHPSSRKLFIFCLNWKPRVKKCGQDLLYSENLRTCVHP